MRANPSVGSTAATYDFSGRVAAVTGGSSGIGQDIVDQLLKTGAKVSVWDMKPPDASFIDRGVCYVAVDVTDYGSVEAARDLTVSTFGALDLLVNSAGFAGRTAPLAQSDPQEWMQTVAINLFGVYNSCRAAVPALTHSTMGRIVNIASLAGKEGTPNASAYSAAKAAVLALTKSLGKELADTRILVNAIAPAAVRTQLLQQMSPAHVQTMIDKSPMKRLGECSEVSALVLWLLSGSCTFSTGATFDLSGGRATY